MSRCWPSRSAPTASRADSLRRPSSPISPVSARSGMSATQFALLTSLMAIGRTVLASGSGWLAERDRLDHLLRAHHAARGARPAAALRAAAARQRDSRVRAGFPEEHELGWFPDAQPDPPHSTLAPDRRRDRDRDPRRAAGAGSRRLREVAGRDEPDRSSMPSSSSSTSRRTGASTGAPAIRPTSCRASR